MALDDTNAITDVLHVRQDYIVGQRVQDEVIDPSEWSSKRDDFRSRWRRRARRTIVEEWIKTILDGQKRWIHMEAVKAVPTATLLQVTTPPTPKTLTLD